MFLCVFLGFHYSKPEKCDSKHTFPFTKRRKGMYSKFHPPRILLFILCLFLDFLFRNQRSETLNIHFPLRKERRECILNSTPLESCFVFWVSFFETREVRLFLKGSLRAIPPRSLLLLFFVFITPVSRSREFIAVTWRGAKPRTPCFVSEMIHMLPRELARQKKAGGLGGAQPVPWTLNVYSARALCFLGFFPKQILKLGSRLRRSIGPLLGGVLT